MWKKIKYKVTREHEVLIKRWCMEVRKKARRVNPDNNDYTWFGIAVGFFLGAGCSLRIANNLAWACLNRDLL